MGKLPDMTKHRGFPSGMPGTGVQFTIRRANPKGVTPIKKLPRRARPGTQEHRIDAAFLHALWHYYHDYVRRHGEDMPEVRDWRWKR